MTHPAQAAKPIVKQIVAEFHIAPDQKTVRVTLADDMTSDKT